MFKNLTIYRIGSGWVPASDSGDALQAAAFAPCTAMQDKSVGWVPPRGEENGALVELVAGQRILKLMIETKTVPGAKVRELANAQAASIEATTGRKPGKKQMRELLDDARLLLLPQVLGRQVSVAVWIDMAAGLLFTDASSTGKADEVITALVRAFDGLTLQLLQTTVTPQTAMACWLAATHDGGWPEDFHIERECELKSADEEKAAVKFSRHNLATNEVRKHITEGKLPTRLALSHDGRVGFTLTEAMQLKKVTFLEGAFSDRPDDAGGFDADVALATGELQRLVPALVAALGGELVVGANDVDGDGQCGDCSTESEDDNENED